MAGWPPAGFVGDFFRVDALNGVAAALDLLGARPLGAAGAAGCARLVNGPSEAVADGVNLVRPNSEGVRVRFSCAGVRASLPAIRFGLVPAGPALGTMDSSSMLSEESLCAMTWCPFVDVAVVPGAEVGWVPRIGDTGT